MLAFAFFAAVALANRMCYDCDFMDSYDKYICRKNCPKSRGGAGTCYDCHYCRTKCGTKFGRNEEEVARQDSMEGERQAVRKVEDEIAEARKVVGEEEAAREGGVIASAQEDKAQGAAAEDAQRYGSQCYDCMFMDKYDKWICRKNCPASAGPASTCYDCYYCRTVCNTKGLLGRGEEEIEETAAAATWFLGGAVGVAAIGSVVACAFAAVARKPVAEPLV